MTILSLQPPLSSSTNAAKLFLQQPFVITVQPPTEKTKIIITIRPDLKTDRPQQFIGTIIRIASMCDSYGFVFTDESKRAFLELQEAIPANSPYKYNPNKPISMDMTKSDPHNQQSKKTKLETLLDKVTNPPVKPYRSISELTAALRNINMTDIDYQTEAMRVEKKITLIQQYCLYTVEIMDSICDGDKD